MVAVVVVVVKSVVRGMDGGGLPRGVRGGAGLMGVSVRAKGRGGDNIHAGMGGKEEGRGEEGTEEQEGFAVLAAAAAAAAVEAVAAEAVALVLDGGLGSRGTRECTRPLLAAQPWRPQSSQPRAAPAVRWSVLSLSKPRHSRGRWVGGTSHLQ